MKLCLHKSPFYTIMAVKWPIKPTKSRYYDGWDDSNFEVHEEFIGLSEVESITLDSIVSVVKVTLIRLKLSMSTRAVLWWGKQYDPKWSSYSAIYARRNQEPYTLTATYMYGHAMNLAVSDAIKGSKVMKSCLDTAYEITKFNKYSLGEKQYSMHWKMNCHLIPVVFVFYVRPGGQFVQNH